MNWVVRPDMRARNKPSVEEPLKVRVAMDPDSEMVRVGKAVNGRGGLEDGQEVMNAEAREKTSLGVWGTSIGPLQAEFFLTAELSHALCLASVVRILPAAVKNAGLVKNCAAPR